MAHVVSLSYNIISVEGHVGAYGVHEHDVAEYWIPVLQLCVYNYSKLVHAQGLKINNIIIFPSKGIL